jgi:meiotically up-regulated gene 157 (Mug157) protein
MLKTVLLLWLASHGSLTSATCARQPQVRPKPSERRFVAPIIDAFLAAVAGNFTDPQLATLFENTLPNTLDTTVYYAPEGRTLPARGAANVYSARLRGGKVGGRLAALRPEDDSAAFGPPQQGDDAFIVTGDIDAMWQRDSTNQVLPYLAWARDSPRLRALFRGLIARQTRNILLDPYANAFTRGPTSTPSPHAGPEGDATTTPEFAGTRRDAMVPGVYERKWELDSLCNVLHLSAAYYAATGDASPFLSSDRAASAWLRAMQLAVATMVSEQASSAEAGRSPAYQFQRSATAPTDTLQQGRGWPALRTGMVKSAFRGSDDATRLPFNVPENAFAVVALEELVALLDALVSQAVERAAPEGAKGEAPPAAAGRVPADVPASMAALALRAGALAREIDAGIRAYGVIADPGRPATGRYNAAAGDGSAVARVTTAVADRSVADRSVADRSVFAYEVDGHGNQHFMDDANVPGLLSIPFYGYADATDPRFRRTRAAALGPRNPWFFSGSAGRGVGGPHVGLGRIWPMAIVSEGWTAQTDAEVADVLQRLVESAACTGLMHESFSQDDVGDFTRPWFAWMNSYFASFVIKVMRERPHLVLRPGAAHGLPEPVSVPRARRVPRAGGAPPTAVPPAGLGAA